MKIIQIMPFSNAEEHLMKLNPDNPRSDEYIAGLALVEDESGSQSIEWVVWDYDRSIRITSGLYVEPVL